MIFNNNSTRGHTGSLLVSTKLDHAPQPWPFDSLPKGAATRYDSIVRSLPIVPYTGKP